MLLERDGDDVTIPLWDDSQSLPGASAWVSSIRKWGFPPSRNAPRTTPRTRSLGSPCLWARRSNTEQYQISISWPRPVAIVEDAGAGWPVTQEEVVPVAHVVVASEEPLGLGGQTDALGEGVELLLQVIDLLL